MSLIPKCDGCDTTDHSPISDARRDTPLPRVLITWRVTRDDTAGSNGHLCDKCQRRVFADLAGPPFASTVTEDAVELYGALFRLEALAARTDHPPYSPTAIWTATTARARELLQQLKHYNR